MQTSAKMKASEFMRKLDNTLPMESTEHLPFGLLQKLVVTLLLEHERDTRYTAIDIVQSMDDEVNCENSFEVINRGDAVHLIHNLKVGM